MEWLFWWAFTFEQLLYEGPCQWRKGRWKAGIVGKEHVIMSVGF